MNRGNRFYTLLIIPERTSQVRRWIIPSWMVRTLAIAGAFVGALAVIMLLDYWYVMGQISENKDLRVENRKLRQQVQVFENRIGTVEDTLERIKTFSMRLKVITNIEDRNKLIESLNEKLPEANANIDIQVASKNPDELRLARDQASWDHRFVELASHASLLEQQLQDQYELLADRKAFLNALPTRKPAVGYFTSGFGVRRSPYGGREKMHEGLDIANYPGTPIRATAEGTVVFAGTKAGYGQTIILDHGYGLETWYAHNRKILVRPGQRIRRGDLISQLGNSGRSTGPHLHYEVRINGTPVDPLSYILEN